MESTEATFSKLDHTVGISSVLEQERPTHSDFDDDEDESFVRSANSTPANPASAEVRQSESEARERHGLLGRKAVDALVIAAVTDNQQALGQVVEDLLDGVTIETGPIDTTTVDGTVRVIEAVTELAREVEEQAGRETIHILRDRIEKLEALVEADPVLLMAELEQEKLKNADLSRTIKYRDATISVLNSQKNDRALQDEKARQVQQEHSFEGRESRSFRQRMALGARSAASALFSF